MRVGMRIDVMIISLWRARDLEFDDFVCQISGVCTLGLCEIPSQCTSARLRICAHTSKYTTRLLDQDFGVKIASQDDSRNR